MAEPPVAAKKAEPALLTERGFMTTKTVIPGTPARYDAGTAVVSSAVDDALVKSTAGCAPTPEPAARNTGRRETTDWLRVRPETASGHEATAAPSARARSAARHRDSRPLTAVGSAAEACGLPPTEGASTPASTRSATADAAVSHRPRGILDGRGRWGSGTVIVRGPGWRCEPMVELLGRDAPTLVSAVTHRCQMTEFVIRLTTVCDIAPGTLSTQ